MLGNDEDFSLAGLLRCFESVEDGQIVVELADSGEKKGNFELRLKTPYLRLKNISDASNSWRPRKLTMRPKHCGNIMPNYQK